MTCASTNTVGTTKPKNKDNIMNPNNESANLELNDWISILLAIIWGT
jgi:hypothetical protein